MDAKEFLEAKALLGENQGLSQYEQIKVGHMNKKASGTAIAGLVVGVGAAVAAIGVGAWATAKASEARRVAVAKNEGTEALLNRLAVQYDQYMATERQERINGDQTITQTITDTVSGSQQGQLTAMQQAELAASQAATQQVMTGLMTGRYSENPQRVALYQDARPCNCPASGCGCNG